METLLILFTRKLDFPGSGGEGVTYMRLTKEFSHLNLANSSIGAIEYLMQNPAN